VDRVSIERMCAGGEFQVEDADTEKAREEKLLVIQAGLVRTLTLIFIDSCTYASFFPFLTHFFFPYYFAPCCK